MILSLDAEEAEQRYSHEPASDLSPEKIFTRRWFLALHEQVLKAGLEAIRQKDVRGKAVTPFLLDFFRAETGGASVRVNMQLVRNNARLAAQIASCL